MNCMRIALYKRGYMHQRSKIAQEFTPYSKYMHMYICMYVRTYVHTVCFSQLESMLALTSKTCTADNRSMLLYRLSARSIQTTNAHNNGPIYIVWVTCI